MKEKINSIKELVSLSNLEQFSKKIANNISSPYFIGLKGEMGAGKTTFTRFLIEKLSDKKHIVTSPTFSLVNLYEGEPLIVHADLFRLNSYDDLIFSGIEEYLFETNAIVIVEWYEKVDFPFPKNHMLIEIEIISEDERLFTVRFST